MGFSPCLREMDPTPAGQRELRSSPGDAAALVLISDTSNPNPPKEPLRACAESDGAGKKISSLLNQKGANMATSLTACCRLFSLGLPAPFVQIMGVGGKLQKTV